MAMFDTTNVEQAPGRSRRVRHISGKSYTGEGERSLELRGILEVLSVYQDYEGGINCCVCGKLYKSKVCFIKHLWEHSVYWNLFPGDKNHERVLAIQAALILYSKHYGVSYKEAESLMDLLVTAPSCHEAAYPPTPRKDGGDKRTCMSTPRKDSSSDRTMNMYTPQKPYTFGSPSEPAGGLSVGFTYPITPQKDSDKKMVCPGAPHKHINKSANKRRSRTMVGGKTQKRRRLDFGVEKSCEFSASETLLELRAMTL